MHHNKDLKYGKMYYVNYLAVIKARKATARSVVYSVNLATRLLMMNQVYGLLE